jgi:NTE family protein
MSGPWSWRSGPVYGAARWHAARLARDEIAALRATGTPVVVFRPSAAEQTALGDDLLSGQHVPRIIQRAFFAAGAHVAQPHIRWLFDQLRPISRPAASA